MTVNLVDIFEIVLALEMYPGKFGFTPAPTASKGNVYFAATPDDDEHGMQQRVNEVLSGEGLSNDGAESRTSSRSSSPGT